MSVLVVGISHRSAPVSLLERVAVDPEGAAKLAKDVAAGEHVTEAAVIATCNRLEIYADVDRFHGSVEELSGLLVERAGRSTEALLPHLYVHYDDGAVSHLFQVAAGLDSMAVGEAQILGQTRDALARGQEGGTVGPALNVLFQQALRVGKRAHAETGIDQAAPTLVSAALDRVGDVAGRRTVVVGAGSIASLATATLVRRGATDVVVVNRTPDRASRLAAEHGVRAAALADLVDEVADADLVVTCTGSTGVLLTTEMVADLGRAARRGRPGPAARRRARRRGAARRHPGHPRRPGRRPGRQRAGSEVDAVREIVAQEVAAFLGARRQASVTPTVVALRSMATGVVDAELARLMARLPDLDDATRAEVLRSLRRVADKLLHQPTVRVKELANEEGAVSYAAALAELFALDPDAVEAVTRPEGLAP